MSCAAALARCLRLGTFLAIMPFKVTHNPKTESYSCIFHRKILKFSLMLVQVVSIAFMLMLDWAGLYTQKTIRKLVYSLFNVHAICGLITLWIGPKKFETVLNSVQEFQDRAEELGIVLPSQRKVTSNVSENTSAAIGCASV